MKHQEVLKHSIPTQGTYYLFTEEFLSEFLTNQHEIIDLLKKNKLNDLNGYITEKQAIELLNKKTTWFWQMRKEGKLKYKTIGRTKYYLLEDIHQLLQKGS